MGGGNQQEYNDSIIQRSYADQIQKSRMDLAAGKTLNAKDPWTDYVMRSEDPAAKKARMLRAEAEKRAANEESQKTQTDLINKTRKQVLNGFTGLGRSGTFASSPGSTAGVTSATPVLNKTLGGA